MPRKGANLSPAAKAKQDAAIKAWHRDNLENLSVSVRKGKRDAYKRLAAARGVSVAGMIQAYMDAEYFAQFGEEP